MDYDPKFGPSLTQIAVKLADVLDQLKHTSAASGPYGPDFTADGMCRWYDYISEIREASGHRVTIFDEFWEDADHSLRCRKCREDHSRFMQAREAEKNGCGVTF
jgi:hypothetical protein